MKQLVIKKNALRCKKCGDVIESKSVYDMVWCSCKSCAVDGGHEYLRRCGNPEDWEDLSVTEYADVSEPEAELQTDELDYLWIKEWEKNGS